jgi:hypothetical protein
MPSYKGFWSYVHADDAADGGRIARLARDIASEFEMQTGEAIELFLDRDELQWGDNWRNEIDNALASVAFFIPVLTPRYFRSVECRRELQFFARKAIELGVRDLVLPLLYVDVPALQQMAPTDEMIPLIRGFQWEDWRELRFADPTTESYRRGVSRLTARLVAANHEAEAAPSVIAPERSDIIDEEPGLIDEIAASESAMPRWQETIYDIAQQIEIVGQIMTEANEEMQRSDRAGKGFGGRLYIAKKVARRLAEPADHLAQLGSTYASQMHEVNGGIRALIQSVPEGGPADAEELQSVCEFFNAIREMAASAETGLGQIEEMVHSASALEAMSRDLRPPLRRMKEGLTRTIEARAVIREWVRLIDTSGVHCAEPALPTDPGAEPE